MSLAKASATIDDSGLVQQEAADATDVKNATDDLLDHIKNGRFSVSDNDTHLKTLIEALNEVSGNIKIVEVDDAGDETLTMNLDADGVTSGYVATANGSNGWAWAAAGGGGATPVDLTVTAGEDLIERDFVFLNESDGEWYKIDIDAAPVLCGRLTGCVNESGGISEDATGSVRTFGEVTGFSGLTAWNRVYAHSTAGGHTQTKPSPSSGGAQVAVVEMGMATSATAIFVNPGTVEYMKRNSVTNGGLITIEHHSDAAGRSRKTRAYRFTSPTGNTLESYGNTNRDSDVYLKKQTPATYGSDECSGGTASASSEYGGNTAAEAFDDTAGTKWRGDTAVEWLEYDFGTNKTIRRYTVTADDNADHAPKDWTFEYYNGSSWVVADVVTGETSWGTGEQRSFDVDDSYTAARWRLNITENNGFTRVTIREVEMLEAATYDDGNDKLAQSFQLDSEGDVPTVRLWLRKQNTPTGNLTVKIETDNSGSPSGTTVTDGTSASVAVTTLSSSYSWITFTFSGEPSLTGSTSYWLVLETSDAQDGDEYVAWGADGSVPSYASGEMKSEASSTWSSEGKDGIFEVNGVDMDYENTVLVDYWESSLAVVVNRYDDGAGSNVATNTTFKNKLGATADLVCVVELA